MLLNPHLRFVDFPSSSVLSLAARPALPRPRGFRYLIEADDAEGCDADCIRVSRSHPDCAQRRGRAPADLGSHRRLDRRVADLVGAPHAPAAPVADPRDGPTVRAHGAGWWPLRFEGARRSRVAGEL